MFNFNTNISRTTTNSLQSIFSCKHEEVIKVEAKWQRRESVLFFPLQIIEIPALHKQDPKKDEEPTLNINVN